MASPGSRSHWRSRWDRFRPLCGYTASAPAPKLARTEPVMTAFRRGATAGWLGEQLSRSLVARSTVRGPLGPSSELVDEIFLFERSLRYRA